MRAALQARSARFEPVRTRIHRQLLLKSIDADHQGRPFGRDLGRGQDCGCPRCSYFLLGVPVHRSVDSGSVLIGLGFNQLHDTWNFKRLTVPYFSYRIIIFAITNDVLEIAFKIIEQ